MKKLIALIVVAMFATATFAQDQAAPAAAPAPAQDAKEQKKTEGTMAAKPAARMPHECYMMKEGQLMHCMGDKAEVQKEAVTLKNGTTLTPSGEMKMKDGTASKIENGQCVSMMGSVGDCEKMHMTKPAAPKVEEKK